MLMRARLNWHCLGARGKIDRPRALILGGVHGDEPEGISAACAVLQNLDLEQLRGEVLVLPLANLAAWKNGTKAALMR